MLEFGNFSLFSLLQEISPTFAIIFYFCIIGLLLCMLVACCFLICFIPLSLKSDVDKDNSSINDD